MQTPGRRLTCMRRNTPNVKRRWNTGTGTAANARMQCPQHHNRCHVATYHCHVGHLKVNWSPARTNSSGVSTPFSWNWDDVSTGVRYSATPCKKLCMANHVCCIHRSRPGVRAQHPCVSARLNLHEHRSERLPAARRCNDEPEENSCCFTLC